MRSPFPSLRMRHVCISAFVLLAQQALQAQVVQSYDFAQSSGSFTSLSSGTTLQTGNGFDDQVFTVALPQTFYFDNVGYAQVHISCNGFITFGTAPAGTNYTPLSSNAGYAGAVSAFGADLQSRNQPGNSGTRDLRYDQVGDEFVIEWRQVRRKGLSEWFSFQIRLNFATSAVRVVYGEIGQGPATGTTHQPEVGLRGPNNSHANNVDNRRVDTGSETWATSLPGNTNDQKMRFTSTAPAKFWANGQTYVWTPECVAPVGTPCDDGNACTINDVILTGCICTGTVADTDADGVCDANDNCPTVPGQIGSACDDGDACTINDVLDAGCDCAGTFQDTDGDEVCDADDECPMDPSKILAGTCGCGNPEPGAACDDGDESTANDVIQGDCACAGTPIDCNGVIGGPDMPGSPCDDGNSLTVNDSWSGTCVCEGVLGPCTEDLQMVLQADGAASETSWAIYPQGSATAVCEGVAFGNGVVGSQACCVHEGCYELRVYDSGGDGMTTGSTGGYTLRYDGENGARIIDNRRNFNGAYNGSESSIANGEGFCLPMGQDKLIFTSCDKLHWVSNEHLVASLNPQVTSQWVGAANAPLTNQDTNSGYEYWFFDPNGSYSFRRFRSHAENDGYGTLGYDKAAHLRLNLWEPVNHLPVQTLLNVRMRTRVNGIVSEWGPACRFMLDPVGATCPTTQLLNIPGNPYYSCGSQRYWATNQAAHANPVPGATQYRFRFTRPAEGIEIIRTSSSYYARLGWTNGPALELGPWDVHVSAFVNGSWCPEGEMCVFTICTPGNPCPSTGGTPNMFTETGSEEVRAEPTISAWPNPVSGDHVFLGFHDMGQDSGLAEVRMYDLTGKQVMHRTITFTNGSQNSIHLDGDLGSGIYLMNITIGSDVKSIRMIVTN